METSRKLTLVLDLDHTLLHTQRACQEWHPDAAQDLHHLPALDVITKLRPGVRDFLREAASMYHLHIYTMGHRLYARAIADILDPNGTLFGGRVTSRCDMHGATTKDLDCIHADERKTVVVDDTPEVWPHHRQNVMQVPRYQFLDEGVDEDGSVLLNVLGVLRDVHGFYWYLDARIVLSAVRTGVLDACTIAFSRCWAQGTSAPHEHLLWRIAESLGATCVEQFSEEVTHVVSLSRSTEKVHRAWQHGKRVVRPEWLHDCSRAWQHLDEDGYSL